MTEKKPIGIALASFGRSGRVFHAPYLLANPTYEVVSVMERTTERACEVFPSVRIVRTYQELIDQPNVDVIVVNTPDTLHYEMAAQAIRAGKHVVVEKPLVPTRVEARDLTRLARKHRVTITTFFNRRYDADFEVIRTLIRDGVLGNVLEMESRYDQWRPVDSTAWREHPAPTSSALHNIGSHLIDQVLTLFGTPAWVFLDQERIRPDSRIFDSFLLRLGYPGRSVTLQSSYAAREPFPRFRVRGSRATAITFGVAGSIIEGNEVGLTGYLYREDRGLEPPETLTIPATDYGRFYRDLFPTIRSDGRHPISIADATANVALIEAAQRSHKTGRRLDVHGG